jgi:hypothetical protein
MESERKVFLAIGLPKTGTKSVRAAFANLGMQTISMRAPSARSLDSACFVQRFQQYYEHGNNTLAFDDFPWYTVYSEIALLCQSSYFVLTYRSTSKAWIESYLRWPERYSQHSAIRAARNYVFGAPSPRGNESQYLHIYEQHGREVQSFFSQAGITERLLALEIESQDAHNQLASFVSQHTQQQCILAEFPHINKNR